MSTRRMGIALVAALLSGAIQASPAAEPAKSPPYLELLGVCPDPEAPSRWLVVWHPEAPQVDPVSAMRVFKNLQGPDLDACLVTFVQADQDASSRVRELTPDSRGEAYGRILESVRRAWARFGVEAAMAEVATTGARGPQTAKMLESCRALTAAREDRP